MTLAAGPPHSKFQILNLSMKNKYHILIHICGIHNNGVDDLIFKAEIETQKKCTGHQEGTEMVVNWKIEIDIYTLLILCIKQTTNEKLLFSTGNST